MPGSKKVQRTKNVDVSHFHGSFPTSRTCCMCAFSCVCLISARKKKRRIGRDENDADLAARLDAIGGDEDGACVDSSF